MEPILFEKGQSTHANNRHKVTTPSYNDFDYIPICFIRTNYESIHCQYHTQIMDWFALCLHRCNQKRIAQQFLRRLFTFPPVLLYATFNQTEAVKAPTSQTLLHTKAVHSRSVNDLLETDAM